MKVLSNGGALLPSRGEAIAMMKVVLTVTARLLFEGSLDDVRP